MITATYALNDRSHLDDLIRHRGLIMTGQAKGVVYLQDTHASTTEAWSVLLELKAQGIPLAITRTEEIPL